MHTPNACTLPFLETSVVTLWQVYDEINRWDRSSGCCWYQRPLRSAGIAPGNISNTPSRSLPPCAALCCPHLPIHRASLHASPDLHSLFILLSVSVCGRGALKDLLLFVSFPNEKKEKDSGFLSELLIPFQRC